MDKICCTVSLFHASTCFEYHLLIVRRSKLYYTASGIIIPIGGRPVHGTATYRVLCSHIYADTLRALTHRKELTAVRILHHRNIRCSLNIEFISIRTRLMKFFVLIQQAGIPLLDIF